MSSGERPHRRAASGGEGDMRGGRGSVLVLVSLLQPLVCWDAPARDLLLYYNNNNYNFPQTIECSEVLHQFAESASNFTLCSIHNARPIHLCEHCITQYMNFNDKYHEALNTSVNGTSCKSVLISNDKLEVVLTFYDNIISVWNDAQCDTCYDWTNNTPTPSNSTLHFYKLFNETKKCINDNIEPSLNNTEAVCKLCMSGYIELDDYYQTLNGNKVDDICMDIIDAMNTTRSVWSGTLNCCQLRQHPEIIFLCLSGVIAALPILFYLILKFCLPMRDLLNTLKQTRFKQTFLAALQQRRHQT